MKYSKIIISALIPLQFFGCSSDFNKASVRPVSGAPLSVQVEPLVIPLDQHYPQFLVAVEPVRFSERIHTQVREIKLAKIEKGKSENKLSGSTKSHSISNSVEKSASALEGARSDTEDPSGHAGFRNVALGSGSDLHMRTVTKTKTDGSSDSTSDYLGESHGSLSNRTDINITETTRTFSDSMTPHAIQMQAQLLSALAGVGNFTVLSNEALMRKTEGRYDTGQRKGVGPYVIRTIITEYDTEVESNRSKVNLLIYKGDKDAVRGVVGIDVQIVDGRNGNIFAAFPVHASFSSRKISKSLLGNGSSTFARSLMDQAMRVALNEAAQTAYQKLIGSIK